MSLRRFYNKIFPERFGPYWKKIEKNSKLDADIRYITNTFIKSESYKYVSNFWHILNKANYRSLINEGFDGYGTNISNSYFTFNYFKDEYLPNCFSKLENVNEINLKAEIFKKQKNFNYKESCIYNYLCLLLFENLKKTKYFDYLHKLKDETYLGFSDPFIKIDGINVSTDKLISLFDLEKINSFKKLEGINTLLEIGSGSGRLSECILTFHNKINYVICDIPPAIYISYKRLKLAFPNKKISLLLDNNDKESLTQKIKNNDISFIFPHQLKFINSKYFDIILAVDCLHEMDKEIQNLYFSFVDNLTKNFYFSIWNKTKNHYSKSLFKKTERLDFNKGDYAIPKNWENIFKENLIFPSNYLGLGYNIK